MDLGRDCSWASAPPGCDCGTPGPSSCDILDGSMGSCTSLGGCRWVWSLDGSGHAHSSRFHLSFSPVCSLQWNFIQAKTAMALAQALQSNSSLASLE